jgi:type II secretory pathway component PulJ
MRRTRGFVLFEYMIAFVCSAMMIIMVASVMGELYVRITHYSAGCITTIELARAWFLLEHDLAGAPADNTLWKKRSPSEFIYSTSQEDCGWSVKRDRLLRTRGFYDASRGLWHSSHETVALLGVQRFAVRWVMDGGRIGGYEVTLQAHDQTYTYWVACRQDRIVKVDRSQVKV